MDWTLGNINNPCLIVLLVYTHKLEVKGRVHYSLMSVINGLEQATHLENEYAPQCAPNGFIQHRCSDDAMYQGLTCTRFDKLSDDNTQFTVQAMWPTNKQRS